jgi:hypothetical protein
MPIWGLHVATGPTGAAGPFRPLPAAEAPWYALLLWQTTFGFVGAPHESVMRLLVGYDYVVLFDGAALVRLGDDAALSVTAHHSVASVLEYLAQKEHVNLLRYVLSPPLPGPAIWTGYISTDWAAVNRITATS